MQDACITLEMARICADASSSAEHPVGRGAPTPSFAVCEATTGPPETMRRHGVACGKGLNAERWRAIGCAYNMNATGIIMHSN